jgi:hypothetical protein
MTNGRKNYEFWLSDVAGQNGGKWGRVELFE